MKKIYKNFLLLATFMISLKAETITLEKNEFNASNKLGDIGLIHRDKSFFVIKDGEEIEVQNAFVSKEVRNLSTEHIEKFVGRHIKMLSDKEYIDALGTDIIEVTQEEAESLIAQGYFIVGQTFDGEYTIKSQVRVLGGCVALGGWMFYLVGKTVISFLLGTIIIL